MILAFEQVTGRGGAPRDLDAVLGPGDERVWDGAAEGRERLMRLAIGAERPVSGSVRLFGEDPFELPPERLRALRSRCAVVPRDALLIQNLSARDNAALPARWSGDPEAAERTEAVFRAFDLLLLAPIPAWMLSKPERRTVALLRAAIQRPALLVVERRGGDVEDAVCRQIRESGGAVFGLGSRL